MRLNCRAFPKDKDAWREADRLGLGIRINDTPAPGRASFHFLAEDYLKVDFGADSVRPKSANTISHVEHIVRAYLVPRFGNEIAEDIKPLDIQRWFKSLRETDGPARARPEESCPARRDALEDRLQGHRHHARANACDSEGPPLTSSLHAGAHLRRHGAPCFGDAGAALERCAVE